MKYLQALFVLIFALVLAGFIQQNSGSVYLKYFNWTSPEMPLSLFMIIAFAAGYAMAVVLGFSGNLRNKVRATAAERDVKRLSQELDDARHAPGPENAVPDDYDEGSAALPAAETDDLTGVPVAVNDPEGDKEQP
jgi:uncharacterized integral membrane protein